ncbi:hypothetical protein GCM10017673_14800 [Streptosporangium violaceochromogenes]|nr:hypothetical protein GCM10017673_14800 [Streptosporangium violaceochromogenes]
MKLQLINADGDVLDTVTLIDGGVLRYETGAARGPVESWQRARDLDEQAAFGRLVVEGWSNGYATLRAVG